MLSFLDLFKLENLPELIRRQPYDTSQYDAVCNRPSPISPEEAAALLQRTDDNVDFNKAWNVLRDMAQDEVYQNNVLRYIAKAPPAEEESATIQPEANAIEVTQK